ncbi:MAG TPA: hypothetical protein VJK00_04125, partial [Steroidobacteraceae bacterium]|nr:hypothetical protein [Steroidobacteraceae bacterium]
MSRASIPGFPDLRATSPCSWKRIRSAGLSPTSPSAPLRSGGTFDYDGRNERLAEVLRELEDPA